MRAPASIWPVLAMAPTACVPAALDAPTTAPTKFARGTLQPVAEGPCARLSVEALADRRILVFGDTGYELADWAAGERLVAAQSLVELRPDGALHVPALLRGLPHDARGYVPAELRLGARSDGSGWLHAVRTRYAPRGTGQLFVHELSTFTLQADGWRPHELGLDLGAGRLPELPRTDACEREGLALVPLTHAFGRDGSVHVAGRCQDDHHVAYADTTLVVASAKRGDDRWQFATLPASAKLDGIVNTSLSARAYDDVWLSAFEPYAPTTGRHSYVVHFDGQHWREVDLHLDEGVMSLAERDDGELFIAAGRGLYRRDPQGIVHKLTLPPPRGVAPPPELHVTRVQTFAGGDTWVEASHRVRLPQGERGELADAWASVLYSDVVLPRPLYCDARETASKAVFEIDGSSP